MMKPSRVAFATTVLLVAALVFHWTSVGEDDALLPKNEHADKLTETLAQLQEVNQRIFDIRIDVQTRNLQELMRDGKFPPEVRSVLHEKKLPKLRDQRPIEDQLRELNERLSDIQKGIREHLARHVQSQGTEELRAPAPAAKPDSRQ